MEQIKIQGHCIIGICKGVSSRTWTNRTTGEVMTFTELGIGIDSVDQFGYSQEQLVLVTLTKAQIADGTVTKIQALKDKRVAFPVWCRAFNTKNGGDMSIYLTNDWHDKKVELPAPLKAAS